MGASGSTAVGCAGAQPGELAGAAGQHRPLRGPAAARPFRPDADGADAGLIGPCAASSRRQQLPAERLAAFRFHHISTDEEFGSLGETGRFSETTPYDPRSPYSASKAASDHLVNAWHHTYGLPVVILKPAAGEPIPLYGDGLNVRDWLTVEDHVDALLLAATRGQLGRSTCVGGHGERTNKPVVEAICQALDQLLPAGAPHSRLITPVSDRPGHDRRYAIDPTRISTELGWQPRHSFEEGLAATVRWFLYHQDWCARVREQGGYSGGRLGVLAATS